MTTELGLLNDPWVIGVAGGIISSIVVAFISRFIFSRRDQREYFQRINQANQEILYAIRPGISEGLIPSIEVIKEMILATGRKYDVETKSMYTLDDISSELIKEIMDSSFISTKTKKDYCELLSNVKEQKSGPEVESQESKQRVSHRYQQQLVLTTSILVGALTMTSVFVLFEHQSGSILSEPANLLLITVPAIVAVLIAIVSVIVRDVQRFSVQRMNIKFGPFQAEFSESKKEREKQSGQQ